MKLQIDVEVPLSCTSRCNSTYCMYDKPDLSAVHSTRFLFSFFLFFNHWTVPGKLTYTGNLWDQKYLFVTSALGLLLHSGLLDKYKYVWIQAGYLRMNMWPLWCLRSCIPYRCCCSIIFSVFGCASLNWKQVWFLMLLFLLYSMALVTTLLFIYLAYFYMYGPLLIFIFICLTKTCSALMQAAIHFCLPYSSTNHFASFLCPKLICWFSDSAVPPKDLNSGSRFGLMSPYFAFCFYSAFALHSNYPQCIAHLTRLSIWFLDN